MNGLPGKQRDRMPQVMGGVFLALACLAGWWSWTARGRAERAERRLSAADLTWQTLVASEPAPTAEVLQAWQARREGLEQRLRLGRAALGTGAASRSEARWQPPPEQRAEAFFALARFVEAQREAAGQAGVTLPVGCMFGFSAYANSGPAEAELELVHRQQQVVLVLLELVWSSGATGLTRVQREVPAAKLEPADGGGRRLQPEGRREDYLELPRARSLSRSGLVDTLAFRIGFIGKTSTLRRFLNQMMARGLPLIVRAVEVEPLGADGAARGGARSLADLFRDDEVEEAGVGEKTGAVPIIDRNDAEFLVTVEYVEFLDEEPTVEETSEP